MDICRRLYERQLISGPEGNVSLRVDHQRYLVTPSGQCKGIVSPGDLLVVDGDGAVVEGSGSPSSELAMHLAIYRNRPDVGAIVHAHPPAAVAYSLLDAPIPEASLPETLLVLGPIARVDVYEPGTVELAEQVATALRAPLVTAILACHGAVTLGRTLDEAWLRMEVLEASLRALWMAQALGPVRQLPDDIVRRLRERFIRAQEAPPGGTGRSH